MDHVGPALSLVVIRSADLEASRAFYDGIGLRFEVEQHDAGPEHLSSTLGETVFELYPSAGPQPASVRLGFIVEDLDSVVAGLRGCPVTMLDRSGARVAVVTDPDGNKVELTEPR